MSPSPCQRRPYAIVFGLKHSFNHLFKEAADTPAPAWYRPVGAEAPGGHGKGPAMGASARAASAPSLEQALDHASESAFQSLSQVADSLFASLEAATAAFTSPPASSESRWSGGGESSFGGFSHSSFGGFSGSGGGGGSSGFG